MLWLASAVIGLGLALVAVAVAAQQQAPQPPRRVGAIDPTGPGSPGESHPSRPASSPTPTTRTTKNTRTTRTTPATAAASAAHPLGPSRPIRIEIPAIGVRSLVRPIGLAPDGTLAVPQPGPNLNKTAWFKASPTPGQPGPAIIEGHVDSVQGPSVFFRLGQLRPGDTITVRRADGIRLVFTINAVRDFAKTGFPTRLVYGARDLGLPQLRLITCSDFDAAIGHHTGNEVVFAHLTAAHHPHPHRR